MNAKKILTFALIFLINIFSFIAFTPSKAASTFTVTASVDKATVKPGDTFEVTYTATNTGAATLVNFEIRVPYLRTLKDAPYQLESPSFNKLLDSIEYPSGFQSRSWVINSFSPSATQSFRVQYKVDAEPKTPNGIISNFTLPVTWVDPTGLPSNTEQKLPYLRADVYLNKTYSQSVQATLPKLSSLDNQVALVTLPSAFTGTGSKTTNLKTVTNANIKAFPNFTLETTDVLIEWTQPVDLSGADVAAKLTALDTNLKLAWGKIDFTSANLAFLAKPVKITFKDTAFISESKIKVGTETKDLSAVKGVFTENTRTTVINLDVLSSASLVPFISTEIPVIESEVNEVTITGTVNDPRSVVTYTINGGESKTIGKIDLQTGKFEITVNVKDGPQQVEVSSKFKNGETTSKVIVAKLVGATDSPKVTTTKTPSTVSLPFNQVTIGLILAALAIISIIGGVIYYLFNKRKANKKNLTDITLNPKVNKVSSIGTGSGKLSHGENANGFEDTIKPNPVAQKLAAGQKIDDIKKSSGTNLKNESTNLNEPKIDLNELRKKYEINNPEENLKNEDKNRIK